MSIEINHQRAVTVRDFAYNCGIYEHSFSSFRFNIKAHPNAVIKYFNWYFSPSGGNHRGAALVFTDNNDTDSMHLALTKVSEKICLGRNSNSSNRIYMWVLSRQSIENYERKKKDNKKRQSAGKKIGGKKVSKKAY